MGSTRLILHFSTATHNTIPCGIHTADCWYNFFLLLLLCIFSIFFNNFIFYNNDYIAMYTDFDAIASSRDERFRYLDC